MKCEIRDKVYKFLKFVKAQILIHNACLSVKQEQYLEIKAYFDANVRNCD